MRVRQEFRFEAAHHLPRHPGKCKFVHGHSYRFALSLDLPVSPETGMTMDFSDIHAAVEEKILRPCDHRNLNDFLENPTAELIAVWVWQTLRPALPGLAEVELWEVEGCSVVYRGEAL